MYDQDTANPVTLRRRINNNASRLASNLSSVTPKLINGFSNVIAYSKRVDDTRGWSLGGLKNIHAWKRAYFFMRFVAAISIFTCLCLTMFMYLEWGTHQNIDAGIHQGRDVLQKDMGPKSNIKQEIFISPSMFPMNLANMRSYDIYNYPFIRMSDKALINRCNHTSSCVSLTGKKALSLIDTETYSLPVYWDLKEVKRVMRDHLKNNPSQTCACARYHGVCSGSFLLLKHGIIPAESYFFLANPVITEASKPYYVAEVTPADPTKERTVKRWSHLTLQYSDPDSKTCAQHKMVEIVGDQAFCIHSCLLANQDLDSFMKESIV